MIYIVDIETKPNKKFKDVCSKNVKAPANYKDQEKIDAYIAEQSKKAMSKMALSQDYSEIFCIGVKELGKPAKIMSLQEFADLLMNDPGFHLVTFNGNKFDIPIIIKQAIQKGITLPFHELMVACKRFDISRHLDLIELLSFGSEYKSLDTYLEIYCGVKKTPIDFDNVTDEELKQHCIEDVCLTERLYAKFGEMV